MSKCIAERSSGYWRDPEKKTAEDGPAKAEDPGVSRVPERPPFLATGGRAQQRYEALRAYMLLPRDRHRRANPARFDLSRFERFGLLGLMERDPLGEAWRSGHVGAFHVEVIPVGTGEAGERRTRLYQFLHQLTTEPQGGTNDPCGPLHARLHRDAGEGEDDPEPARRRYSVC